MVTRWGEHVRRRPVLGAVELALGWQGVVVLVAKALPPLTPHWFPQLGPTVVNLVAAAAALALLRAWGMTRVAGVATWGGLARWPVLLPVVVVSGLATLPGLEGDTPTLIGGAVLTLGIGLSEELGYRALVLQVAQPLGAVRSVALSAVLFGAAHLDNYLFFGASWNDTRWQLLSAGLFGFCLGAARLVIGSVWPLVLVHAQADYLGIYSPGRTPDWLQGLDMLVSLALGLVLLRRHVRRVPAPEATGGAPVRS
ncbi:CPBP family intramembrane glutamic endopeptidase [Kitasatospora sp. NPDC057965]|uniref:CPBP family intramembrane glutamic endopeptidase n=1 Tax=Kitasatospora sp. NPDC057965 TaxID=3346291 RepID=UPI0036D7CE5C